MTANQRGFSLGGDETDLDLGSANGCTALNMLIANYVFYKGEVYLNKT